MKCILALLCVVASAAAWTGDLRVRFGGDILGLTGNYYIKLPKSVSDAKDQGWTQEPRPENNVLPILILYCHENYMLCVLFDDTEYVAGVQIAFREGDVQDATYDFGIQGYSKWTPSDGNVYQATAQYFVDEEFMSRSAEERVASRDPKKILQAGGRVWLTGIRGELVELSNKAPGILAKGFTRQACIPFMGIHYFRDMAADLQCTDETMFPWFGLTDRSDDLIASGLVVFGKLDEKDRDWFERPPKLAVQLITPRAPECLYELASAPGLLTMHIYYVDTPRNIIC